jgi:uncharacterized protein
MNDPNDLSSLAGSQAKSVAFIITHTIKAGEEKRYEAWLAEIQIAVRHLPGYLGREIFRPAHGGRKYTSILRFDTLDHLNAWAESETRQMYVNQVNHLLEKGDQVEIRTGVDFWFTPSGIKPPKPWKQFLLTLTAVYPLSLFIPRLLRLLLDVAPILNHELIRALLMALTLTGLLTFVIMPRYTRLMKRWLYEETE